MSGAVHARQMLKSGGLLAAFGVVTAALLAGVYGLTKDQIAAAQQARLLRELQAVLPAERYDNDLALDTLTLDDPRLGGRSTVYRARLDGRPAASIFTVVAPDGYSGDIRLLVGVTPDGTVTGVRVTEHRETPALATRSNCARTTGFWPSLAARWATRRLNVGRSARTAAPSTSSPARPSRRVRWLRPWHVRSPSPPNASTNGGTMSPPRPLTRRPATRHEPEQARP